MLRFNTYHIEYLYKSRFTCNANGLQASYLDIRSYSIAEAMKYLHHIYPSAFVTNVTFLH